MKCKKIEAKVTQNSVIMAENITHDSAGFLKLIEKWEISIFGKEPEVANDPDGDKKELRYTGNWQHFHRFKGGSCCVLRRHRA